MTGHSWQSLAKASRDLTAQLRPWQGHDQDYVSKLHHAFESPTKQLACSRDCSFTKHMLLHHGDAV